MFIHSIRGLWRHSRVILVTAFALSAMAEGKHCEDNGEKFQERKITINLWLLLFRSVIKHHVFAALSIRVCQTRERTDFENHLNNRIPN